MKILLIGREGQVAWELRRTLACLGEVVSVDSKSAPCRVDLSDPALMEIAVHKIRPQLVINAAAYTAVDKAEQESDLADKVNGVAPGILAQCAHSVGAGIIHYSTDYVFDGAANQPYSEEAETNPQSVYGETKLKGDHSVLSSGAQHLILRTSWVYGGRGKNFLLTMLRLMEARDQLTIVDDQCGAPTWCRLIAECTAQLVVKCSMKGKFAPGHRSGIYNLTCGGQTSWFEFASQIGDFARKKGLLKENCATLVPIATKDYPTPAFRPAYSVLSSKKLHQEFDLALPCWTDALEFCLDDFKGFTV